MDWQTLFYALDTRPYGRERVKRYRNQLARHFHCGVWGTKDGRAIPVKFMRDSHLQNAVHHSIRAVWKLYGDSCQYSTRDERCLKLYAEATHIQQSILMLTSEQGRRGYEPTDHDLKALGGMERTLHDWFPREPDFEFEGE